MKKSNKKKMKDFYFILSKLYLATKATLYAQNLYLSYCNKAYNMIGNYSKKITSNSSNMLYHCKVKDIYMHIILELLQFRAILLFFQLLKIILRYFFHFFTIIATIYHVLFMHHMVDYCNYHIDSDYCFDYNFDCYLDYIFDCYWEEQKKKDQWSMLGVESEIE